MEKTVKLFSDMQVIFTDEPERAKELSASGSCFITSKSECKGAAAYVERPSDFEELSDEFLIRTWCRFNKKKYQLLKTDRYLLRECDRFDYGFVTELLKKNRDAVTGLDEGLWTDDITAELQFENTIRDYYSMLDFGLWLLMVDNERVGIFGLSSEDYGVELYYILDEGYRGKGIATDICEFICKYARIELGLDKVYIRLRQNNKPSRRLAERLGFKKCSSEAKGSITELKFVKEL